MGRTVAAGTLLAALVLAACSPSTGSSPPQTGASTASAASAGTPAGGTSSAVPAGFETRPAVEVEKVIDGDTVVLAGGERIRVLGIDTPEMNGASEGERRLAAAARAEMLRLLASGNVIPIAEPGQRDKYDRTLAYLHAVNADGSVGEDLGARLLETGFARTYSSTHPRLAPYLQLQEAADSGGRGLWTAEGKEALGMGVEVEIAASSAHEQVGRRARVLGEVFAAHRSEGALYLNLGPDWKRDFTAVVVKTQWELFPEDAEKAWLGRRVAITGLIEEREGRPQIRLRNPWEIKVLED